MQTLWLLDRKEDRPALNHLFGNILVLVRS